MNDPSWARLLSAASVPGPDSDPVGDLRDAMLLGLGIVPGETVGCSLTELDGSRGRTPASSGQLALELDLAQYEHQDGPCVDAASTGAVHRVDDMIAETRYPIFTAAARAHGVGSSLSVPLPGTPHRTALNVYARSAAAFSGDRPVAVATLLARLVGRLLAPSPVSTAPDTAENDGAVDAARARGALVIAARRKLVRTGGGTEAAAFGQLVRRSRDENISIFEVARDVVAEGQDT